MNDFDDLLPWRDAVQDLLTHGPLPDILNKITNDTKIHIGFKERHADLL